MCRRKKEERIHLKSLIDRGFEDEELEELIDAYGQIRQKQFFEIGIANTVEEIVAVDFDIPTTSKVSINCHMSGELVESEPN